MRTFRSRGSERKGERRRGTHAADDDDGFGMSERAKPSNFPSLTTTREREREKERSPERRRRLRWSLDRSRGIGTSEAVDLTNWRTLVSRVFLWTHFRRLSRFQALASVWELFLIDFWRARTRTRGRFLLSTASVSSTHYSVRLPSWESSLFSCALWRERRTITVIIRRTRSRTRRRPREDPWVRRNADWDERRITTC